MFVGFMILTCVSRRRMSSHSQSKAVACCVQGCQGHHGPVSKNYLLSLGPVGCRSEKCAPFLGWCQCVTVWPYTHNIIGKDVMAFVITYEHELGESSPPVAPIL